MMRIKGVGKLRTRIYKSTARHTVKRFVRTNGMLAGADAADELGFDADAINKLLKEIKRVVRAGYEVRLGTDKNNCVRFYPLLDKTCKFFEMQVQALGNVKNCLDGMKVIRVSNGGEEIGDGEVDDFVKEQTEEFKSYRASLVQITPDTVVECPKCGTAIRVGKALSRDL